MKTLALHYLQLTFFAMAILSACAGNTKKDAKLEITPPNTTGDKATSASIEAKLAAAQEGTSDVTEIVFDAGSSQLNESNSTKIAKSIEAAQKKAKITHVTIVAWSDAEMPKKEEQNLGKDQTDLAEARGNAIEHDLQTHYPGFSSGIVNMAKRPSSLSKFFKSANVRIQQALKAAGGGDPKAKHAIVIIETDEK